MGGVRTMAQLLDANVWARMMYSPYKNSDDAVTITLGGASLNFASDRTPESEPITGWFAKLVEIALEPLGIDPANLEPLFDERARVVTAAVATGATPTLPCAREAERIYLERLVDVNAYGNQPFYGARFSRQEMQAGYYARYEEMGTHFVCSSHAFAMLGRGGFSHEKIREHMGTSYHRLFLLTLFYAAVLHTFARRISDLTPGLDNPDTRAEFRALCKRFTVFTNMAWFDVVSPQLQGVELFSLMRGRSPIDRLYKNIRSEIERSDELLAGIDREKAEKRQTRRNARANTITTILAAVAVMLALLPITEDILKPPLERMLGVLAGWLNFPPPAIVLILYALLIGGTIVAVKFLLRRKMK